jgi:hypothetical protein
MKHQKNKTNVGESKVSSKAWRHPLVEKGKYPKAVTKWVLALLSGLWLGFAGQIHAANNLISNGDMESWTSGVLNNWTTYYYSQSCTQSNVYKYRGTAALLLQSNPSNYDNAGTPAITQNFTIPAGHKCINVRFYYQADDLSSLAVRIREQGTGAAVKYYNGSGWSTITNPSPWATTANINPTARTAFFQNDSGVASDKVSWKKGGYSFWQKMVLQIPANGTQTNYAIDFIGGNEGTTSKAVYLDDVCVTSTPEKRTVIMQAVSWFTPANWDMTWYYNNTDMSKDARGQVWDQCDFTWDSNEASRYDTHVSSIKMLGVDVISLDLSVRNSANGNPSPDNPFNQTFVLDAWIKAINANTRPGELKIAPCIDNFPANSVEQTAKAILYMVTDPKWKDEQALWRDDYGNIIFTSYALNAQFDSVQNDPNFTKLSPAFWTAVKARLNQLGVTNFVMIGDCYENPYKTATGTAGGTAVCEVDGVDAQAVTALANSGMFNGGLSCSALSHHLSWLKNNWTPSGTLSRMEYILNYNVGTFWTPGVINGMYAHTVSYIEPKFEIVDWCWSYARSAATNRPLYNRWVNMYTWNDIREDTSVWPGNLKGLGLYNIQQFYMDWYKMDCPIATNDQIAINYPVSNSRRNGTTGGDAATETFNVNYWGNFSATNTKLELKNGSTVLATVTVSGTGVKCGSFPNTNTKLTQLTSVVVSRGGVQLYSKSLTAATNQTTENLRYRYVWINPQ